MKKSTFGLLAASALLLTPVAAFAQDNQSNLQIGNNGAAAVGEGHYINQVGVQQSTLHDHTRRKKQIFSTH